MINNNRVFHKSKVESDRESNDDVRLQELKRIVEQQRKQIFIIQYIKSNIL